MAQNGLRHRLSTWSCTSNFAFFFFVLSSGCTDNDVSGVEDVETVASCGWRGQHTAWQQRFMLPPVTASLVSKCWMTVVGGSRCLCRHIERFWVRSGRGQRQCKNSPFFSYNFRRADPYIILQMVQWGWSIGLVHWKIDIGTHSPTANGRQQLGSAWQLLEWQLMHSLPTNGRQQLGSVWRLLEQQSTHSPGVNSRQQVGSAWLLLKQGLTDSQSNDETQYLVCSYKC